jgi:hypothetical protein
LPASLLGIGSRTIHIVARGVSIVSKMRMILIPLTVVAAIVVMAMSRRPGKLRGQRQGR